MKRLEAIIRADPDLMDLLECLRSVALPQWRIVSGCLYQTAWNVLCGMPRGTGIQDIDLIYFDDSDLSWEAEDAVIRRVMFELRQFGGEFDNQRTSPAAHRETSSPPLGAERPGEVGVDWAQAHGYFRGGATSTGLSEQSPYQTNVPACPHLTRPLRPQGRRGDLLAADRLQIRNQARVHLWYGQRFGTPYAPLRSSDESLLRYPVTVQAIGARLEQDSHLDLIAPFGVDDVFDMVMRPNPDHPHPATFAAKVARARTIWPRIQVA